MPGGPRLRLPIRPFDGLELRTVPSATPALFDRFCALGARMFAHPIADEEIEVAVDGEERARREAAFIWGTGHGLDTWWCAGLCARELFDGALDTWARRQRRLHTPCGHLGPPPEDPLAFFLDEARAKEEEQEADAAAGGGSSVFLEFD